MKKSTAIAILGLGGVISAPADLLHTRDGRVLSGKIQLKPGPTLHIQGPSGNHQFPLVQIKQAIFGNHARVNSGLRNLQAAHYRGTWQTLPVLDKLKPQSVVFLPGKRLTLHPHNALAGYAMLYTGDLLAPSKGDYQFQLGSDDGARLLINGKVIIDNDGRHGLRYRNGQVNLNAGSHTFRLEYFNHSAAALLKLDWNGPGIAQTSLTTSDTSNLTPANMTNAGIAFRQPGILTWGGSFIPHPANSADASAIVLSANPLITRLSTINAATLVFEPVTLHRAQLLRSDGPGLLLRDGKFVGGKIVSIKAGHVEIQSVLFGRKTYPIQNNVTAIQLRRTIKSLQQTRVYLNDGTQLAATHVKVDKNHLVIDAQPLRQHRIPINTITRLQHGQLPDPLSAAWTSWAKLDPSSRKYLQAQQSTIFNAANQVVSISAQERNLIAKTHLARESLAAARVDLESHEKQHALSEANATQAQEAQVKAAAASAAGAKAMSISQATVATAKAAIATANVMVSAAKAAHDQSVSRENASKKGAADALANLKKNQMAAAVAAANTIKQAREKLASDLKVANLATTNRINSLTALSIARRHAIATVADVDAKTKVRAAAEASLNTAKTTTANAQAAMGRAQTTLSTRQNALNAAQSALTAAVNTKLNPAKTTLTNAKAAQTQAKVAKEKAVKKLAEIQVAVATALVVKNELAVTLTEITRIQVASKGRVDSANLAMAKAEQDAKAKRQQANSLRATLENIVNNRQAPLLATYAAATNNVSTAVMKKLKIDETLTVLLENEKNATASHAAAEASAAAAEAANKIIQEDPKMSKSAKDAAAKKAAELRQVVTAKKNTLSNLQENQIKPTRQQADVAAKALASAQSAQKAAENNLTKISGEITRATNAYTSADKTALNAERNLQQATANHRAAVNDHDLSTKSQAEAKANSDAAAAAHANMIAQQETAAKNALKTAVDNLTKATTNQTAADKALASAINEEAKAKQILAQAKSQHETAAKILGMENVNLNKAKDAQADHESSLKSSQDELNAAIAAKTNSDNAVKQAEAAVKQAADDELAKLKPLAEARATLEIELEREKMRQAQAVLELKDAEKSAQELSKKLAMETANADAMHKAAIKAQAAAMEDAVKREAEAAAAKKVVDAAVKGLQEAQTHAAAALRALTEQSRLVGQRRTQVNTLRGQLNRAELALEKFRLENRRQLEALRSGG